jgi:DNA (cytosine-5)-methyltransferase 1
MLERRGFVGVKDAAAILDVAPNTIRAWGAAGKITEYRHPANNYRLYKRSDLERLIGAFTQASEDERHEVRAVKPKPQRGGAGHLGLRSEVSSGQSFSEAT